MGTRKRTAKGDPPIEALSAAPCFLVLNAAAHYWAALHDAAPPGLQEMQAASMIIVAPSSAL